MTKVQTIEDFYRTKANWMPDNLKNEIGHFNVFHLRDFVGPHARATPYSRKNYFKISLMIGRNRYCYADKTVEVAKNAVFFANSQVPYHWEPLDDNQEGFFCVFTEAFFDQHLSAKLHEYPVFRPAGQPIYFLTDAQQKEVSEIYLKMLDEIDSDYTYKYDVLRNLVFELIHKAQKLQPATTLYARTNASIRISSLFMELLERQYPIESNFQRVKFRSAQDFATQLSLHVNHLNKALKETTGKATSTLIAERQTQEAMLLLKHTRWNIAEIAYALGFEEVPHFNNFFKKHSQQTPSAFRKSNQIFNLFSYDVK
jgi:AraC-like DNA-binding protein